MRSAACDASSRLGDVLDQDGELVAAEPRDRVAGPDRVGEALADRLEQRVAGRMTEAVVDGLEVVEVEEEHRDPEPGRAGATSTACSTRSVKSARLARPVSGSWNAWCRSCSSASRRSVMSRRYPWRESGLPSASLRTIDPSRSQTVRPSRAISRYSIVSGDPSARDSACASSTRSRSSGCSVFTKSAGSDVHSSTV